MTRPGGGAAWTGPAAPDTAVRCEIRVAGHLDNHWAATLGNLDLVRHDDGTTSLTGPVLDQAQLHGLLARVRDLGVPLLTLRTDTDGSAAPAGPAPRGERVWGGAVACVCALVAYGSAVRVGESRGVRELALRPAAHELAAGALLGLVLMAVLMGTLASPTRASPSCPRQPSPRPA